MNAPIDGHRPACAARHHGRWQTIIGYHDHRRSSDTTTIDDHCDSMWLRPSTVIDLREHNDRKWQRSSIDGHRFAWAAHHHSKWQTCIAPIDGHDLREHKDRSSAATIIDFRLSISELLVGYLHHIDGTKKKATNACISLFFVLIHRVNTQTHHVNTSKQHYYFIVSILLSNETVLRHHRIYITHAHANL